MMSNHSPTPRTGNRSNGRRRSNGIEAGESIRRGLILAGLQLAALVVISILFAVFDLDRSISAQCFDPHRKWAMGGHWLWANLYRYGTIPGAVLAIGCLAAWLATFFNGRLIPWRPYFLLVVLTTVIAAGILVNSVFKPYWGRPRPNQIVDFGGYYAYRHVFPPGTPGKGASFPCGHCTMGFTFLSLYFVKRRSKILAYTGTAAGMVLGSLLAAARIINGAHFTTDAIWSLGMVSITAILLYYCVLKIPAKRPKEKPAPLTKGRTIVLTAGVCIAAMVIIGAFMTRRPFFKTNEYLLPLNPDIKSIEIEINIVPEKLRISYDSRLAPAVLIHAHGFGWAYVAYDIAQNHDTIGDRLRWQFQVRAESYFSELDHTVEVVLPENRRDQIAIKIIPNPQLSVP
jgi:lipid A 4'-phosphatase